MRYEVRGVSRHWEGDEILKARSVQNMTVCCIIVWHGVHAWQIMAGHYGWARCRCMRVPSAMLHACVGLHMHGPYAWWWIRWTGGSMWTHMAKGGSHGMVSHGCHVQACRMQMVHASIDYCT